MRQTQVRTTTESTYSKTSTNPALVVVADIELLFLLSTVGSGFLWYKPPLASTKEHSTGGHEWTISGHDMQVLTTTVPAGEEVITEIGSFMFGSSGIETTVELTLCSKQGCGEGWNRVCGGESCVKVRVHP